VTSSRSLPSLTHRMQRSLFPLDSETRSKIRSTQILTSIPQIISELVQNSLDANASHINIGVDISEWECWVRDDGCGISKEGMSILAKGSTDGRYGKWQTIGQG
jgi:DNA mismatch repair protein MLH3